MEYPYKFILHVGDIKSGQTTCTSRSYSDVAQIFAHPSNTKHYDPRDIFFLVGDNEWSDCSSLSTAFMRWMNNFGNGQKVCAHCCYQLSKVLSLSQILLLRNYILCRQTEVTLVLTLLDSVLLAIQTLGLLLNTTGKIIMVVQRTIQQAHPTLHSSTTKLSSLV